MSAAGLPRLYDVHQTLLFSLAIQERPIRAPSVFNLFIHADGQTPRTRHANLDVTHYAWKGGTQNYNVIKRVLCCFSSNLVWENIPSSRQRDASKCWQLRSYIKRLGWRCAFQWKKNTEMARFAIVMHTQLTLRLYAFVQEFQSAENSPYFIL